MAAMLVALYPSRAPVPGAEGLLGAILGRTAYEARLWVASRIPRIVARPADATAAAAIVDALVNAGFDAEALDAEASRRASDPIDVRVPALDASGVSATDRGERLSWSAIATIVRAQSRATVERSSVEVERVYAGDATVSVIREHRATSQHTDEVLYVFPREGRPWLIQMDTVRLAALGAPLRPTHRENFLALVERIRASAHAAAYSDELLHQPPPRPDVIGVRDNHSPGPIAPGAALDLTAMLIHRRLGAAQCSPYRHPG